MEKPHVLTVEDLTVRFPSGNRFVSAVNGINLSICKGETIGIVGESGCGKSVFLFSLLQLLPPEAQVTGKAFFGGQELLSLPLDEMRKLRGKGISIVFQEPMTSLNPVLKINTQLTESIILHEKVNRQVAREKALELLQLVEIPDAARRLDSYPHQLSGGMRQRVMIAMALACKPQILLADEPTTALDVTIQAQTLDLMNRLKQEYGMSIAIVTHDMGVIAEVAERVVVVYAGRVLEEADTRDLFAHPLHPYTEGLLGCIPLLNAEVERLNVIEGMIPDPINPPAGCPFHPRCLHMTELCRTELPVMKEIRPNHWVACHMHASSLSLKQQ